MTGRTAIRGRNRFVALATASSLCVAGCSGGSDGSHGQSDSVAQLTFAAKSIDSSAEAFGHVRAGSPVSLGAVLVCLTRPGAVRLTRASIDDADGVRAGHFGVRPNPLAYGDVLLGDAPFSLKRADFAASHRVAGRDCKAQNKFELAIELLTDTPGKATASGFSLHYVDSEKKSHTLGVPYKVALCASGVTDDGRCE